MKRSQALALRRPAPRDVQGFHRAQRDGLVPVVPIDPPTAAPDGLRPTSSTMLMISLLRVVGCGVALAGLAAGCTEIFGLPEGLVALLVLPIGLIGMVAIPRELQRVRDRLLEETAHGYATSRIVFGGASGGRTVWTSHEPGMPWNFDGVWILDSRFTVRSPPERSVDPPGYYPSPHHPHDWELWSGAVWSGVFRGSPEC